MSQPHRCPDCGGEIPPDAPEGLCRTCLLNLGLKDPAGLHFRCPHCHNPVELLDESPVDDIECPLCRSHFSMVTAETVTYAAGKIELLGHFELIERVGIGHFGSVWKARDTKLDRTVAVKVPRKGQLDPAETDRFLREARAAAQVRHPNIVSVHEVGRHEDSIYIVSDFVEGASLTDWLTSYKFTQREAAELCVKIAEALHEAHEAGVVHRDLKPGNIMLDVRGEPSITDFGLAKRDSDEITMTVEGKILGTPAYMSPEQARGDAHLADRRSDIYSLGVVLFQLLTGELPFRGRSQMLIVQILRDVPPSPRKLAGHVSRDLETICLKCIEKEPAKRYATAAALADDLKQFLAGKPISARPISRVERGWRWCRRQPASAAMIGLCATTVLALTVLGVRLRYQERLEQTNSQLAGANEELADTNDQLAKTLDGLERTSNQLRTALKTEGSLRKEVEQSNIALTEAKERIDELLYFRSISLAEQLIHDRRVGAALAILGKCPENLRNWEWRHLMRCARPEFKILEGVATKGAYDTEGHYNVADLTYSSDGKYLVSAGDVLDRTFYNDKIGLREAVWRGAVLLWNAKSGDKLATIELLTKDKSQIRCAAINRAGTRVVTGTGKVWDVETRKLVAELAECDNLSDVSFNSSGQRVAGKDSIWNAETGERLHHFDNTAKLQFCNDDTTVVRVVGKGADCRICITNIETGANLHELQVAQYPECVAVSPDLSVVAYAWNPYNWIDMADIYEKAYYQIGLWDLKTNEQTVAPDPHVGHTTELVFSPDRKYLISSGSYSIRKRDARTGDVRTTFSTDQPVNGLAMNPAGDVIAAGLKSRIKLLNATDNPSGENLHKLDDRVVGIKTDTTGSIALSAAYSRQAVVWDALSGKTLFKIPKVETAALSPGGKQIALSGGAEIAVHDVQSRAVVQRVTVDAPRRIVAMAYSPDGGQLAALATSDADLRGGLLGQIVIWNLTDVRNPHHFDVKSSRPSSSFPPMRGFSFSPDSKRIGAVFLGKTCSIWDAKTGEETIHLEAPNNGYFDFAFDPTGGRLALAYWQGIRVYSAKDGRFLYEKRPHRNLVQAVAFTPDGSRILTTSLDGELKISESETGLEVLSFKAHQGLTAGLAYVASREAIVTGGPAGYVRSWSAAVSIPASQREREAAPAARPGSNEQASGAQPQTEEPPTVEAPVSAQVVVAPEKPNPLGVGDPAPPLSIGRWLVGEPIEKLQQGQVYVIEFWATWCPPCRTSMPHLNKLQEQYGDKVRLIGITRENEATVERFLDGKDSEGKTWREAIKYRLAVDANASTNTAYMRAAGQTGIPCAFVVGRDGVVEWIGLPGSMDGPLAKVVSGEWDRQAAIARFQGKKKLKTLGPQLATIQRGEKWDQALALLDQLEKEFGKSPDSAEARLTILQRAGRVEDASKVQAEIVDLSWDDAAALNGIAWGIATAKGEHRNLELAKKAAQRASELHEHKDAEILDTLARVFHEQGRLDEAIEWQRRAATHDPRHRVILDTLVKYETEKTLLLDPSDPRRQTELDRIEKLKSPISVIHEAGGRCGFQQGSSQVVTSVTFESTLDIDKKLPRLMPYIEKFPSLHSLTFSRVHRISSPEDLKKDLPPLPPNAGVTDVGLEHIKSLTGLKALQLRGVKITDAGLEHIGSLKGLETLHISGTQITDAGLKHLKGLTNLQWLQIWHVPLNGTGFEHLRALTALRQLDLMRTPVTDVALEHFQELKNLYSLNLAHTKVSDAGLEHLKELENLRILNLDGTGITDAGLQHLSGLTNLIDLNLSGTKVDGTGFQYLTGLTSLGNLKLKGTAVTDDNLKHIARLTTLHTLILDGTKVTDAGLEHLAGLTNLSWLTLTGTQTTDAGLKHLTKLTKLRVLGSADTQITPAGRQELKQHL